MLEKNNIFIKKIKFQNEFLPFEKSDNDWDIEFNGETEVQELIEFYLNKTKHINIPDKGLNSTEYNKNAKRFKINCVLGNNGGGKSKLFESLLLMDNNSKVIDPTKFTKSLPIDIIFGNEIYDIYVENVIKTRKKYFEGKISEEEKNEIEKGNNIVFILDDFFRLSGNIGYSINREILTETDYNKFYCKVFNFLNSNPTNKKIFSIFLNIYEDFDLSLNINFNFGWREKKYGEKHGIHFLEYEGENFENRKDYINDTLDYELLLKQFEFLSDILNKRKSKDKENIYDLFFDKKDYVKNLWLFLSDIFLAMINNYFNNINYKGLKNEKIIINDNFKKCLELLKEYLGLIDKDLIDKSILGKNEFYNDQVFKDIETIKSNLDDYIEVLYILEKKGKDSDEFKNILKTQYMNTSYSSMVNPGNLFGKLLGNQYSKGSKYLLTNLLYNFSDQEYYDQNMKSNFKYEEVGERGRRIVHLRRLLGIRFSNYCSHYLKKSISINGDIGRVEFSEYESKILSLPFFDLDIKFSKKSFNNLSGGEKTLLTRFTNIYIEIIEESKKGKKDFIILVDEPDLHLHLDWQRKYIQRLIDVFSTLPLDISLHFILATHSPFIVSDLPTESLVLLEKGKVKEYEGKTFGANYIDLIQNGFFFGNPQMLMGSFAEEVILNIAKNEKAKVFENIDYDEKLKDYMGNEFLKDNLIYFNTKRGD